VTVPAESADVLTRVEHGIGRITLNRPRAINALTTSMLRQIGHALTSWEDDPTVRFVLIDGAGERGLCAGGDVRMIWESAKSDGTDAREFFRVEYTVNAHIAHYRKPYVAMMDGVVMGGGVGVSSHGAVRVVTERTVVAMPEVIIGFIPDVGGTYLLSRAPGQGGTHAALTAMSVTAADAIWMGLADYYVPADKLPELVAALQHASDPGDAVAAFSVPPQPSFLHEHRDWIDRCYQFDTVADIVAALRDSGEQAAGEAAATILARSPIAVSVTLESLRRARRAPALDDVLEQEFRVSCAALESHDLAEGIRAQVIDKDRTPRWQPASLSEIRPAEIAAFFEDRRHGSLGLASERSQPEGAST
jgi:enoyl-CoA hydratase